VEVVSRDRFLPGAWNEMLRRGSSNSMRDLHELVRSGTGIDPLKDFSEAAREELRAFTQHALWR
jgi:hypothetical protein